MRSKQGFALAMAFGFAIIGAVAAAMPISQSRRVLPADHPIVGAWEISFTDTSCVESEVFGDDGVHRITSEQEVSVSRFEISAKPGPSGFYRYVDTIIENNGQPDCHGQVTPVGDNVSLYVLFFDDGNSYAMCEHEATDTCLYVAHKRRAKAI